MRSASIKLLLCLSLLCCCFAERALANDAPAFDLAGPNIDIKVSRAGKTLPISEVPNLAVGDRLWVHPDLPPEQSVHYLLIVAFLRGSTNPPPITWFTRFETWKPLAQEGVYVVVPEGAQQALVFLAPETGGDFNTLRNAVRGRPGAFVRASQDLNQASLDRGRLDTYLAAVSDANQNDPKDLQERSTMLARSLDIKLDQQCFDKPSEQQAPCLVKNPSELVLDDGHSQSVVASLASGSSADLLSQLSYTPSAGLGVYSGYVGAVVDMARILDSFHTAQYQYIPALGIARKDALELKLNTPPSFHKPMSVLVVGLPAIAAAPPPPLRPADDRQEYCLQKPSLTLPVVGGPLAFSTNFAHDVVLRVKTASGSELDLPLKADAARGGYVFDDKAPKTLTGVSSDAAAKSVTAVATHAVLDPAKFSPEITGKLIGRWGFDAFDGPEFKLQNSQPAKWTPTDSDPLIVGQFHTIDFTAPDAACVEDVTVTAGPDNKKLDATWKVVAPERIEVQLPLTDVAAGDLTLRFKRAAGTEEGEVALKTYAPPSRLDGFTIYAGDRQGRLRGTDLANVAKLEVHGIPFAPITGSATNADSLPLATDDAKATAALHPSDTMPAKVTLKDGRILDVTATVEAARPRVSLVNKIVQLSAASSNIKLTNDDELPLDAKLTFALKAESPPTFRRNEKIEVASQDNSFHVILSVADNTLVLQDAKTALLKLDPAKAFGGSAFGPLQYRPVDGNGVAGDWQPLITLVRVPQLTDIKCPPGNQNSDQCTLDGSDLFLLDSISTDALFTNPVTVPEGFATSTLNVPRPSGPSLYVKLRDDPAVINTASVPVQRLR